MKIKSIFAYPHKIPLTKPYTIAYSTVTHAEIVFVEISLENGLVGLGSAAPSEMVINETIGDTVANLQPAYLQQWVGRDIRHFRTIIEEARMQFAKYPATQTALDIALHDAFGKFIGIPVVDFYGRQFDALPTSVTIGIMNVADTLSEAAAFKDLGFRILKIKTGKNLEEDIERCVKLREQFGKHFKIRVDANQGYSAQQTIDFVKATQSLGLELVEQPMPVGTENEMRQLPAEIRNRIACDESLKNAKSAFHLASKPAACGIFNIKLMKCGGLLGAFEIATIAKAAGIKLFWGCFDESVLSITAALHAAMACSSTHYIDLDGSFDLAENFIQGGFILENGEMRIPDAPGFGCEKLLKVSKHRSL